MLNSITYLFTIEESLDVHAPEAAKTHQNLYACNHHKDNQKCLVVSLGIEAVNKHPQV